jgi:hypothetical protein
MKRLIAAALVVSAIALTPVAASAGERLNDATLGAGSGLLVFGPVGLVAGGVVGYVAGPGIGRSMGLHHRNHAYRRHAYRSADRSYHSR